ncbi:hypothetical protein CCACVL1_19572 [Corchorus capsularis]|uniref:Uncharacterized protein n=1 Tax=Corchorus capsularis TaxID=210143 RepID=A0A1R3HGA0_COCAP|nr:hypothetical protein CCACVL1_19572 [Corchorus capsularis]
MEDALGYLIRHSCMENTHLISHLAFPYENAFGHLHQDTLDARHFGTKCLSHPFEVKTAFRELKGRRIRLIGTLQHGRTKPFHRSGFGRLKTRRQTFDR